VRVLLEQFATAEKVTSVSKDARPVTVPKALELALRPSVEALVRDEAFAAAIR